METKSLNLTDCKSEVSAYDENNVVIILAGADVYYQDRDETWMVNQVDRNGGVVDISPTEQVLSKGGMVITNTINLDAADGKEYFDGIECPLTRAWGLADMAAAYAHYDKDYNKTEVFPRVQDLTEEELCDECYWGSPSLTDRFFLYKGKLYKPFSHNERNSNDWGIGGRLVFEMVSDCSEGVK